MNEKGISPELIAEAQRLYARRTGRILTEEEARRAVLDLAGFFGVLADWRRKKDVAAAGGITRIPSGRELAS